MSRRRDKMRPSRRSEYEWKKPQPSLEAIEAAVFEAFLQLPPGTARLLPSRILEPGRPEDHVLATWAKIPDGDRDAIPPKTSVRTTALVIRDKETRVPVLVVLTRLGDYPRVLRVTLDPRDDMLLDLLIRQREQWCLVYAGSDREPIRSIRSENESGFWKAIRDAVAPLPPYSAEQFAEAQARVEAGASPEAMWRYMVQRVAGQL